MELTGPALWWRPISRFWRQQTLAGQFAMAGGVVMTGVMLVSGWVVGDFVRSNVLYNRAAATALFIDSAIQPHVQGLATGHELDPAAIERLNAVTSDPDFAARVPYIEIWLPDGTAVYSNSREIMGRTFALPEPAQEAFEGRIVATQADLSAGEHVARQWVTGYTEIYSPVRIASGSEVIAVAEIHESLDHVNSSLSDVTLRSWLTVGLSCLVIFLSLYFIVWHGSEMISRQRHLLSERLRITRDLARHNQVLKDEARRSSRTVTEFNDRLMRTVGADLHDGPSQLISFATLKVERARRAKTPSAREQELGDIEVNLVRALNEIRDIAKGLVLPAIEKLELADVIRQAINLHVARTDVEVVRNLDIPPIRLAVAANVCAFRFIQEGLNNALRHTGPQMVTVNASIRSNILNIEVVNQSNPCRTTTLRDSFGLGLSGLAARVQSLGGVFELLTDDRSTRLLMTLDLEEYVVHE